jgi:membrane protein implicated in regulation of membrane protease activity
MMLGPWDVFLRLLTFVVLLIVLATMIRRGVDGRRSRRRSVRLGGDEKRQSPRRDRRITR